MTLLPVLRLRVRRSRCACARLCAPALLAWLASGLAFAAAVAEEEPSDKIRVAQAQQEETAAEQPGAEQPAAAEPEAAEPGDSAESVQGVEVIHIKGRGVGGIETEVPSSITQFDAKTIEALGAQDISDLSRVTPNVNIVQPGATQAIFFVRGIGLSDFSSNAAGAVTIFQDDVSLNAPAIQTGQLFDIEGVDVVRGPQGSGPFRNASAGAIRVRSRRPTGNYAAQLRSSIGRYDADSGKGANKGLIQDYEGAVEMPIVESWLSSRFAFRLNDAEPFMTNGCGNAPPFASRNVRPLEEDQAGIAAASICGERDGNPTFGMLPRTGSDVSRIPIGLPDEVNDKHNWAARGLMVFQVPDTETKFTLNGHGSRLDQDATLGQAMGTLNLNGVVEGFTLGGPTSSGYREPDTVEEFTPLCQIQPNGVCANPNARAQLEKSLAEKRPLDLRPFRGDYDRVGQETRDTWGGFGSAEIDLFGLNLFLLGSYDAYERARDQDTDFTPDILFEQIEADEAWQTYEEIHLGGELEAEPFEWELGAYYLQEDLNVVSDTTVAGGNAFFRDYTQKIQSYAGWAEFKWDFLDDFTLEGGVRYNIEEKDFQFFRQVTVVGSPGNSQNADENETWSTPTGQLILTYHLSANSNAYARYTRGFKAGHFNALASGAGDPSGKIDVPPADEEYNDAWEAGLRGRWFGGRLSASTAYFYYRYENYQVFLFRDLPGQPPVLEIQNAAEAENYGIEVEGSVAPLRGWAPRLLDGLTVSGNFGWLHGEYLDFQIISKKQNQGAQIPFTVDFSGKQLQNAPQYKVSATVELPLNLDRFGTLIPRYDVSWEDDKFYDPNEGLGTARFQGSLPDFAAGQPAYFLHNVRLAYRTPSGNVELAGWCRNLTDEVYKTFAFDATSFSGVLINFVGEPRTIGVDLTVTF
jgi:iron complex outermembrane receptor protein